MSTRTKKLTAVPLSISLAVACAFAVPLAVASCGGSSVESAAAPDVTPSIDASDESVTDAGAPADASDGAVEAAMTCDLGTLPALPALTSEVRIAGDDGGAPPAPTGGDAEGLWAYTKITLYLPPAAQGQVDPTMSKIDGKGFIALEAGKFRQLGDTTTVLSTSAIGKVTRAATTKSLGTYVTKDTALVFTATCTETSGMGMGGSLGNVDFSRIDATHGRLHVTTQSQLGMAKLVIELEKK